MLTRLWTTVKALRELNRKAPEALARAREREAQQAHQLQLAVRARDALSGKLAQTVDKGIDLLEAEHQMAIAHKLQALEARLEAVQLDHGKIQKKALSNIVDDFEATLLKAGGGGLAAVAMPAAPASGTIDGGEKQ